MRRRRSVAAGVVVFFLACIPSAVPVYGQLTVASIIGQVTDQSGALLPGVTVTATSPALLVPQVMDVTNELGEYRLSPLPIGVYELAFELSGFQPARRQEIRLTVGFTAKVDVQLGVGTLTETLTVSGQAPVVDVTSTGGMLLTNDLLNLSATSRNSVMSLFSGGTSTQNATTAGKGLLESLFGAKLGAVSDLIARSAGIRVDSVSSLLALARHAVPSTGRHLVDREWAFTFRSTRYDPVSRMRVHALGVCKRAVPATHGRMPGGGRRHGSGLL